MAAALLIVTVASSGPQSITGRLGGDFPAFYAAGQIVAAGGDSAALYSPECQRNLQRGLIVDRRDVVAFAYPAYTALFYAPFSLLPYRAAFIAHTAVMVAALALACLLLQRLYPHAIPDAIALFVLVVTAHPVFRSIAMGQNTALSVLLIVACLYSIDRGRSLWAGIFLGLLFFKPQFALPLTGLMVMSGRWRVWSTAVPVVNGLLIAAALLIDPGWPVNWLDAAGGLLASNMAESLAYAVSLMAVAHLSLADTVAAQYLGWLISGAGGAVISWVWFIGGRRADVGAQMGLAVVFIILIATVTSFYDVGLAVIPVIVLLAAHGRVSASLVAFLWLTSHLHLLSPVAGINLLLIPLAVLLVVALRYLWVPATRAAPPLARLRAD